MPSCSAVQVDGIGAVDGHGESVRLHDSQAWSIMHDDIRSTHGWSAAGIDGATPESRCVCRLAGVVGVTLSDGMTARIELEHNLLSRGDGQRAGTEAQSILANCNCLERTRRA